MERLVRKYEQRYKRAQESVAIWNGRQDQLLRLFANAAAVIPRFHLLMSSDDVEGRDELIAKQAESLERILATMREILIDMGNVCKDLEKLWKDATNLLRNEKPKPTSQQLGQRFGSRPSLDDCVDGLRELYSMHRDEHALKVDIVSNLTYDTSPNDLTAMQALLADQPNIPPDEVETIFQLVFSGAL